MEKIKKYFVNKIVVWTIIFVLLMLFYLVPSNNSKFNYEVTNDEIEYESNVVYLMDDDNYVSKVISYFNSETIVDDIKSKINILINGDSSLKSFYSLIPKGTILKTSPSNLLPLFPTLPI